MMAKLSEKAYLIPANPAPESDVCIRVYVPDDPLYIAAFWGCYEYLTAWLAWERDEAHTGKVVADRWKAAYQKSRALWDCSDGSCGLMDVRQKPDEPCTLQKLDDCSDEWVDFAYTQLCAPKMRIVGTGGIEQWNGTVWVPVDSDEGSGGSYDPGHDLDNQLTSWEEPPPGQDGACLSAINAATYLQAAIDASMIELKELPYLVRLVDSILITWFWRVYNFAAFAVSMATGVIWSMSWEDAHKLMSDKSLTHEDDIIAVDIIEQATCIFKDAYSSDGSMTEENYDSLMVDLQSAIDAETPNTPLSMKLEWLMLLAWPGPTWLSNIANNAGIDEYDCSCCDTSWNHVLDFSIGQHSFVPYLYGPTEIPCAVYSSNIWQSVHVTMPPAPLADVCDILVTFSTPCILREVDFRYSTGSQAAGIAFINILRDGESVEERLFTRTANNAAVNEHCAWGGEVQNVVLLKIGVHLNNTLGWVTTNGIEVSGCGFDLWEE